MTINAAACTILMLVGCSMREGKTVAPLKDAPYVQWLRRLVAAGLSGVILISLAGWGTKRAIYGNKFAGGIYADQIRFGPNNTNTTR